MANVSPAQITFAIRVSSLSPLMHCGTEGLYSAGLGGGRMDLIFFFPPHLRFLFDFSPLPRSFAGSSSSRVTHNFADRFISAESFD